MHTFPTDIISIEERVRNIQPAEYASTRNFRNGMVTRLSPYISRGLISTRRVLEHILSLQLPFHKIEKLVQELAWRDYWQQIWISKKGEIFQDLRQPQAPVSNFGIPKAILAAHTGIAAVDEAILELYETGYMHNHMRMYVASICCNIANSHWREPARWMYSHLLDGDLGSNHLSWQWVAGTNSHKKYYANQRNINYYFQSDQEHTFLDAEYEQLEHLETPSILKETIPLRVDLTLPKTEAPRWANSKTTLVYNYYNLDPYWHPGEDVQRVFLLEPSFFEKYPVQQRCLDFAVALSQNIQGIQLFVGEFSDLMAQMDPQFLVFKEHPTNSHYRGREEAREWMSAVQGYYPSFFAFWKKCEKDIVKAYELAI
jgi:deoxyribodipyrimidine photo-lyase